MAQLHAELGGAGGGGGVVQISSTFDWSLFPWFPGREGPLLLLVASSPPPAFMFRCDSLEKLV